MDINGGQLSQTNGNPVMPGVAFTGPVITGTVLHGTGDGTLATANTDGYAGYANAGISVVAQSDVITQATNGTVAGVFTSTNIIIPAQSQILRITLMVTTAWSGASATLGVGTSASATALTAAGAGSGATLGIVTFTPGANATAIGNWDNVGSTDIQIVVTSTNTGNGVGTLTVEYIPNINMAS